MTIITIIIIILQSITSTTSNVRNLIQGGPLLVVNGVIGPVLMAKNTWVTHWGYFIPRSGVTWTPYQAADRSKFIKNRRTKQRFNTVDNKKTTQRAKKLKDKNGICSVQKFPNFKM